VLGERYRAACATPSDMAQGAFRLKQRFTTNNGLTVLERI
jgi:hypothetical protein